MLSRKKKNYKKIIKRQSQHFNHIQNSKRIANEKNRVFFYQWMLCFAVVPYVMLNSFIQWYHMLNDQMKAFISVASYVVYMKSLKHVLAYRICILNCMTKCKRHHDIHLIELMIFIYSPWTSIVSLVKSTA